MFGTGEEFPTNFASGYVFLSVLILFTPEYIPST